MGGDGYESIADLWQAGLKVGFIPAASCAYPFLDRMPTSRRWPPTYLTVAARLVFLSKRDQVLMSAKTQSISQIQLNFL